MAVQSLNHQIFIYNARTQQLKCFGHNKFTEDRKLKLNRRTTTRKIEIIFTARRYASAVLAVIVCPSVRLSVCPSVRHKSELYKDGYT